MHSYFKRKIRRIEVTVRKGVPQEKQGRSKSETRKMIESPPQAPISFTLFSNPLEVPIPFIFSSNPPDVPNRFTLSSNPSRSSWDESISSEVVTCLRNQNLSYAARATSISPWKSTKIYEMWSRGLGLWNRGQLRREFPSCLSMNTLCRYHTCVFFNSKLVHLQYSDRP